MLDELHSRLSSAARVERLLKKTNNTNWQGVKKTLKTIAHVRRKILSSNDKCAILLLQKRGWGNGGKTNYIN